MLLKNSKHSIILIVDDEPHHLKLLCRFLEDSGFRIVVAQSGTTALEVLENVRPDIILLDVIMPGMDGFETCSRLKEHDVTRDIPVIFMTALSNSVDKVKGFEVGGVDYITKPIEYLETLARLKAHLNNRKFQKEIQEEHVRFQALSEATFEGILIHDEGRILDVNQTLLTMFGYQHQEEVLGKPALELFTTDSHDLIAKHMHSGHKHPYEVQGVKKDGLSFPIAIQSKIMPYQGHEARVAAIRDLTWRKHIEQEQAQLQKENRTLRKTIRERYKFGKLIGKSPVMQEVYQLIVKAAASGANVLISGETGTGKELVAQTIHQISDRKKKAFVPVNCGAISEALFEREFFGHRKGSFTGADRDKPGYFDQARGGTLFLDEVGEFSPPFQAKLLRVLETHEYIPVGDTASKTGDVQIIAATNRNLTEMLAQGKMREDFFFRIRVTVITLPPLRERKEDIPLLIEHFLEQHAREQECATLPARVVEQLCAYHWPGNVRELRNEVQRYLTTGNLDFFGNVLTEPVEQESLASLGFDPMKMTFHEAIEAFEKYIIANTLAQNTWHRGKTAEMLDIPPRTLYNKIKKYCLENINDQS